MYLILFTFLFDRVDVVETIESPILGTRREATASAKEDSADYEGLEFRDSRAETRVPPWT